MDIDKVPLLEILVDGVGDQRPHAEHCLKGVGPGTEMGNGPQILKAVALFLQRVIGSGRALHLHRVGLDLKRLLGLGRAY